MNIVSEFLKRRPWQLILTGHFERSYEQYISHIYNADKFHSHNCVSNTNTPCSE